MTIDVIIDQRTLHGIRSPIGKSSRKNRTDRVESSVTSRGDGCGPEWRSSHSNYLRLSRSRPTGPRKEEPAIRTAGGLPSGAQDDSNKWCFHYWLTYETVTDIRRRLRLTRWRTLATIVVFCFAVGLFCMWSGCDGGKCLRLERWFPNYLLHCSSMKIIFSPNSLHFLPAKKNLFQKDHTKQLMKSKSQITFPFAKYNAKNCLINQKTYISRLSFIIWKIIRNFCEQYLIRSLNFYTRLVLK